MDTKMEKIARAVMRAQRLKLIGDSSDDCQGLCMDLDAVLTEENVDRLLGFDDFSFVHDICGIQSNIDHGTARLTGCFLPRCGADAPVPDWFVLSHQTEGSDASDREELALRSAPALDSIGASLADTLRDLKKENLVARMKDYCFSNYGNHHYEVNVTIVLTPSR